MRITMAAARVVMGEWGRRITSICLKAEMRIWLSAFYVDDIRLVTSALKKGTRWQEKEKEFRFEIDWEKEDFERERVGDDDDTRRTARETKKAMNSVFTNIQFETELAEDFATQKLPTLDFEMWFQEGGNYEGRPKILYQFFEKPMNTPFCIMRESAMPEGGKIASLSQEVVRRMQNTSEMLDQEERDKILNNFIKKVDLLWV